MINITDALALHEYATFAADQMILNAIDSYRLDSPNSPDPDELTIAAYISLDDLESASFTTNPIILPIDDNSPDMDMILTYELIACILQNRLNCTYDDIATLS